MKRKKISYTLFDVIWLYYSNRFETPKFPHPGWNIEYLLKIPVRGSSIDEAVKRSDNKLNFYYQ